MLIVLIKAKSNRERNNKLTQPLVTLIRIKAVSSSCVPQDEEIKCFAAKLFLNREIYFKDLHTEFLLKKSLT